ncbi:MAG: PmoA family protein [Phycisphaerae bacterium]|nr:PmoA family protein [Phycisphaerae bacterium]
MRLTTPVQRIREMPLCAALFLISAAGASGADNGLEVRLSGGDKGLPAGFVHCRLAGASEAGAVYALTDTVGRECPGQVDQQGRLWWYTPAIEAGKTATWQARLRGAIKDRPDLAVVQVKQTSADAYEVTLDGKPFTTFNLAPKEAKPYLWPVIGPTGDPVTRAYPMKDQSGERKDHIHHRSIWAAWGEIRSEKTGRITNYWAQAKTLDKQDRQIVRKVTAAVSGPVFGRIVAEIDWTAAGGIREFSETRTYTFFRGDDHTRVIDVGNVFHFDDGDVTFEDTKEAGILSLRVATSMDEQALEGKKPGKGHMTNSAGKVGAKECWGQPAEWCDYVGPVNDRTVGIAVFDAPTNMRHPPRWHIREYGLYAVNPFALKDFTGDKSKNGSQTFRKGEKAEFNYRILIHKGDTQEARVADQYRLYSEQPKTVQ